MRIVLLRGPLAGATALLALSALLALGPVQPGRADNDAELEALRERVDVLKAELEASRSERDTLIANVEANERAIARLKSELREVEARFATVSERIELLEDELTRARTRLPGLEQAARRAVRARWALTRRPRASLLLGADDPADALRQLAYFDRIAATHAESLAELESHLEATRASRERLVQSRAELETLAADAAGKLDRLTTLRADRDVQLAAIRRRIESGEGDLDALAERRRRLERLVEGIAAIKIPKTSPPPSLATPAAPDFASLKGRLPFPVDGTTVTRYRERDPLSGVPSGGILIKAVEGSDVRSVSDGQVVYSDWFRGFGLLLVVDHGDGYMSLYGHNSELLSPVGSRIEAGAVVARAGNTGGRAGSGVYFEIRHQGETVDPQSWCRS